MKFNQGKCSILHLGWGNPAYIYKLGDERLERSPTERELGVLLDKKLYMGHHCALTVQKGNCILGCMKRAGQGRGFCPSTLLL